MKDLAPIDRLFGRPVTFTLAAFAIALPGQALAQTYGALGQPGVGFLMAIVIGAIAGWLAEKFTNSNHGLLMNIIMGIIGAVVGNFLLGLLNIRVYGFFMNLISATVGAIIVIMIYRAIAGRRTTY
jgi:uncharacterized membrane protein YeaQ/YmgE (transglycosylase-associated protein family)